MSKKRGFSITEGGVAVHLWKRTGNTYTCSFRLDGKRLKRSTGETAKDRATAEAKVIVRKELKANLLDVTPGPTLTWRQLFDCYFRDKVPQMKSAWQTASTGRREILETCFGMDTLVSDLDQADVDRFKYLRTRGELYPAGQTGKRKAVTEGTVEADVRWLNTALRWAHNRRVRGARLLSENPLDDIERKNLPKATKRPRRSVASHERYVKTLAKADEIDPAGRLSCMLTLARYTGHREGAICALRASDVLRTPEAVREALADLGLDERRAEHMPNGALRWRAETDKVEHAHIVPVSRVARDALEAYLAGSPRLGEAWLFPSPKTDAKHIDSRQAGKWLVRAEKVAALPKLSGTRWHGYRRLWANERKALPIQDVAAAGGWTDTSTLATIYQKSDPETTLRVVDAS